MKTSNLETENMASFKKSISGCLPERDSDVTDSDSPPVVKRKLCRVSKGCTNSHRSLLVLNTKNDTTSEKRASYTFSEGVAREIGGGDHLVEICVVRGSAAPRASQHTEESQQHGLKYRNENSSDAKENETYDRINPRLADSKEELSSNDAKSSTKRRVAFSDDVTIHSFETEDDTSSEMDCVSLDENFSDENDNRKNYGLSEEETNSDLVKPSDTDPNSSPTLTIARPVYTRKMPLRRAILNQVTRACSTANLLRKLLRESFRKSNTIQCGTKKPLARSRSLPESSIRHSFISADDSNGAVVQLVIALGQHFAPNNISVKTSGDGKKIKVLASLKRSTTEHSKRDYQEWFYLPKPIDPRRTIATVDYEGFLKIEAPFIISSPLNSWTE